MSGERSHEEVRRRLAAAGLAPEEADVEAIAAGYAALRAAVDDLLAVPLDLADGPLAVVRPLGGGSDTEDAADG